MVLITKSKADFCLQDSSRKTKITLDDLSRKVFNTENIFKKDCPIKTYEKQLKVFRK